MKNKFFRIRFPVGAARRQAVRREEGNGAWRSAGRGQARWEAGESRRPSMALLSPSACGRLPERLLLSPRARESWARPCPLQSTSPCPPDGGLRLQGLTLVMFLHLTCSARWRAVPPAVAWAMTATVLEISCQKTEGLGPSPPAARAPACAPQGQAWAVSFWSAQTSLSHKEDGLSQKLH